MRLYHGSTQRLDVLRPSQAQAGEGLQVPAGELLHAIYFTSDREFALAVGAMPEGAAHIDHEHHTIAFEHPEHFDPKKPVYIYEIESEDVPRENLEEVDERQFAVVGLNEIHPRAVHETTAGEVLCYFELKNWKREGEHPTEEADDPFREGRVRMR